MNVYEMDDEPTLYAAASATEAAVLYAADCGANPEDGYPRQLSVEELDAARPEYDEDEHPTGGTTTIRRWLEAAVTPGFLAGALR